MVLKAQIGGYDVGWVLRKNPEGNEHLAGMFEANRLLFSRDSTRKRNHPLGKIELDVCFGDSGNF
jgi:hypothetical protein